MTTHEVNQSIEGLKATLEHVTVLIRQAIASVSVQPDTPAWQHQHADLIDLENEARRIQRNIAALRIPF